MEHYNIIVLQYHNNTQSVCKHILRRCDPLAQSCARAVVGAEAAGRQRGVGMDALPSPTHTRPRQSVSSPSDGLSGRT